MSVLDRITETDWLKAFHKAHRLIPQEGGNFTADGCRALFKYHTQMNVLFVATSAESLVYGLCDAYVEYADLTDAMSGIANEHERAEMLAGVPTDRDSAHAAIREWLEARFTIIDVPNTERLIIERM